MTFFKARSMSSTATRSPIHSLFIISAGWAQTLKLYGIMKCLAMPSPNTASMNSLKFLAALWSRLVWASISPAMHSYASCLGR